MILRSIATVRDEAWHSKSCGNGRNRMPRRAGEPDNADSLDHVFDLPEIDCTLAMCDIYEDLDLPTARGPSVAE